MPLLETEALVLKTYNLAEADKIVLLLTRDHGIVRGVAKGAKRLKSRFGSSLEPFTVVRASYFQKETLELVSIQKLELVGSYFAVASDPKFLQKFSYLIEILIDSLPPQDPNETLYRMTQACLNAAVENPGALDAIGFYFEVWLLRLTGYLPRWGSCSICDREFSENETAGLGIDQKLVCGSCRRISSMVTISPAERGALSEALKLSPVDFAGRERHISLTLLSEIFKRTISQAIGRPVTEDRSLAFEFKAQ